MDFRSNAFDYRHHTQKREPAPSHPPISHSTSINLSDHEMLKENSLLNLSLKQQIILNQFVSIAGCSHEQALSLLSASNWQYQVIFKS